MKNQDKSLSKSILYILIFTAATIAIWIFLDVYKVFSPDKELKIDKNIQVLDPTLNTQVFQNLQGRLVINQEELKQIPEQKISREEEATASGEENE